MQWFKILSTAFWLFALRILTLDLCTTTKDSAKAAGSCHYNLDVIWTSEITNGLLAAAPLVADINADNSLDIISPAFIEEVAVLQGVSGHTFQGSNWPSSFQESSFHASPLLYDIDSDGREDVVLCTSQGQILFVDAHSNLMKERTLYVPLLDIKRDWWNGTAGDRQNPIGTFIRTSPPGTFFNQKSNHRNSGLTSDGQFVSVDAHVLATPVIADLNQDGTTEELVIPVSYYFDAETYRSEESLAGLGIRREELEKYLAGGVVIFNLTSGDLSGELILELSVVKQEFPAYVLFTPTIADLDSEGGPLEIIIGTSAGNLHVLDHTGTRRSGFPLLLSTLHGQVTVEDLNGDGHLEMVVLDTSSNVMCLDTTGRELWDSTISGSSAAGSRVADINQDGSLDIVIATSDGHVWALRGDTGKLINGWPVDLGGRFLANPLIARLKPPPHSLDVIIADYEGSLYIISGDGKCLEVISLEKNTLTSVLAADLIPTTFDLELVVATSDGTLMCLGMTNDSWSEWKEEELRRPLEAWHAETPAYNTFTNWDNKFGVRFSAETKQLSYIAGKDFLISFEIFDERPNFKQTGSYKLKITCGNIILLPQTTRLQKGKHEMRIATPNRPIKAVVTIHVTNQHGQLFQDSFALSFNTKFPDELQWMLFVPFAATLILLLLVYGYPEVDLLPMTQSFKYR